MEKETITQGLGLEESFADLVKNLVDKKFNELERISDIVEKSAEEVRHEDLGEINIKLSSYEKKLVFLGMIIGAKKATCDLESFFTAGIFSSIIEEQKKKKRKKDEDEE